MSESSGPNNWNQKIIEEFHANAGKVGGYFEGAHMILIHHIGARSGRERVNPLTYLPDEDANRQADRGRIGDYRARLWGHNSRRIAWLNCITHGF